MSSLPDISISSGYAAGTPAAEDLVSAAQVDSDHGAIRSWINSQLVPALARILRDDDTLLDEIVRLRNLHPEITSLIASSNGWQPKTTCACASTANLTLSGEQTIDGILTSASRVLVKNQTTASQNGIYVTAAGAWTRSTDTDTADEIGLAMVFVTAGLTLANTSWIVTLAGSAITLGTTSVTWAQVSGSGASAYMLTLMDDANEATARDTLGGITKVVTTIAALRALVGPNLAGTVYVQGYYAANDGGAGLFRYNSVDATADNAGTVIAPTVGAGRWNRVISEGAIHTRWFGTVGDSVTNDSAAFIAAEAASIALNTDIVIDPGSYMLSAQVTFAPLATRRKLVSGYGAEILTTGAISALRVSGRSTPHGVSVCGVKVNHRGNATATAGFEAVGTDHCYFKECVVEAHGTSATYGGFLVRNLTPSDNNTGCFWTVIEDCTARKRSGADPGLIGNGVVLHGAANSTTIRGGSYATCTVGLLIEPEAGQTYSANACLVHGVAFEGDTTAIRSIADAANPISGLRVIGCRGESLTTFLALTGAATQPAVPAILASNYMISSVMTYLNNPNSMIVQIFDTSITPEITMALVQNKAFAFRSLTGSEHAATFRPGGANRGIVVQDNLGNSVAQLVWASANGALGAELRGTSPDYLSLAAIKSIGTGAGGKNLRGSDTFAAATTKVVAFGTVEPDANYFVLLGPQANKTFWVTAKTINGFTLNSSAVSSDVVDWMILR